MMSLEKSEKVSISHCPFPPKTGNSQSSMTAPAQRISRKRYSVGVPFKRPAKRRHRDSSDGQMESVLPTHFLMGGNIFDPLNLNSLLDDDINRSTNQETQKCSPLPPRNKGPVEILVPRDITDPLNLKGDEKGVLLSPLKSRRRHRNRHGGEKVAMPAQPFPFTDRLTVALLAGEGSALISPLPCELNTAITCREDIAPSPVLSRRHTHPPPGAAHNSGDHRRKSRRRTTSTKSSHLISDLVTKTTWFQTPLVGGEGTVRCTSKAVAVQPPKKDKHRYQYGNHCHYYGYHGFYGVGWEGRVGPQEDLRLRLLEADWFRDKKVLDVGCGAGHLTLSVAREFNPAHILGVELDGRLVHAAKQNIRHFLSHDLVEEEAKRGGSTMSLFSPRMEGVKTKGKKDLMQQGEEDESLRLFSFPLSLRVSRGPLAAPPLFLAAPRPPCRFPNNISFIQGDYVSEQEFWPGRGQYDVIICLGVTMWVQLQAGDGGLVRLFRRVYQSLSPGGLFVLEPQPWQRYGRRKKASATTVHHYRGLQLRPEQFTFYLMNNVGFSSYRLLTHTGKQQPIYLFHKSSGHTDRK
ncbi:7SK snRNA methylphosphate capping enzyme-like [Nerophis ophidion]|uniref:7SK snRNA methylphosphate capping enzyme-like n=1 Tax=Nerophis ophidion TaxID=159077 RepID=UPI002ADFCA57|nr:7SK snRNA methylphosphate capping enzyme-like [Nerophis ophidion]XP_061768889.1 7SK snRNA methylphosphate capping enzyme-like [Nerophis ophidion]XP_061768890.1 7SK snRNA methylphosphate capping enzyme-like [Nerophis ophidion]